VCVAVASSVLWLRELSKLFVSEREKRVRSAAGKWRSPRRSDAGSASITAESKTVAVE
jgi:hypothetical protein